MIAPGTRLGRYELIDRIGAGGMGEVYRARDENLNRLVAIKVLPDHLVTDRNRLRRFITEARAASALNHPHIVHVYEAGEDNNIHYMVTEFIEGETLRERLWRRQDLSRVAGWLSQVADALAKAHASGIVHRDLKPENIMITSDGYAKVLDFGLAKLIETDSATSTTITLEHSDTGKVVGTPSYMSPEQVQGERIDHRSDIFSLGCVLYEAIAGDRPFKGDSAVDVMHKIAYEEVDLSKIEDPEGQRIIRKCLAKEPDARYQSTRDLALDLHDLRQSSTTRSGARAAVRRRTAVPWVIAAAILIVLAIVGVSLKRLTPVRRSVPHAFEIQRIGINENADDAAVSPDGRYIAYSAEDNAKIAMLNVWVRQLATSSTIRLFGPVHGFTHRLSFSADGEYVYFFSWVGLSQYLQHAYFRAPILGGAVTKILDNVRDAAMSPSGRSLAFITINERPPRNLVVRTSEQRERILASSGNRESFEKLAWSPDERLLAASHAREGATHVRVWILDSGESQLVGPRWDHIQSMVWSPDKRSLIVVAARGQLDPDQIWRINYPDGGVERLTHDNDRYISASINADGTRIVAVQYHAAAAIWTVPRDHPDQSKMIVPAAPAEATPIWTPHGEIIYVSDLGGSPNLWRIAADGSNRRQVTSTPESEFEPAISPDGRLVAFVMQRAGRINVWIGETAAGSVPRQLTRCLACFQPAFSPDGKWLVYASSAGGRDDYAGIFRTPIDQFRPERISSAVARAPQPSPDGRKILVEYWPRIPAQNEPAILSWDNGSVLRAFPTGEEAISDYRWADEDSFFFKKVAANGWNVWLETPTGQTRQITKFPSEAIFSFDYDRKGRRFVMARGSESQNIVMLRSVTQ